MKRLIMPLILAGLLTGCVGTRKPITPKQQQVFLANQNALHEQELPVEQEEAKAQGLTLEHLQDKQRAE